VSSRCPFCVYPVPSAVAPGLKGGRYVGSVAVKVCAARASNAAAKGAGNVRPRLAARRRMPAAAFGLKKYFDRCGPVSKMSDKEDARASLGDAEVLSVQNPLGPPITASCEV